jgi:hypothetical protein
MMGVLHLARGVLGGDAEQLLGGVLESIIRHPEGQWLLCIVHAAPRDIWSWSLRSTTVSLPIAVSTPAWVTHAVFVLRAHVPLASLAMCLGFHIVG